MAHAVTGWRVAAFVGAVFLVPASLVVLIDEILKVVTGEHNGLAGSIFRGILIALVVSPPLNRSLGFDLSPSMLLAVIIAVFATIAVAQFGFLTYWARFAAFAPFAFVVWFLWVSPAGTLLSSGDVADRDVGDPTAPVVWLVFDQLPLSMMVDSDGALRDDWFPNFTRLASMSTWYPNALTISTSTQLAVPAALTGRLVEPASLPVASQHPINLFTTLGRTHVMNVHETFTQLCPDAVCLADSVWSEALSLPFDLWVILVRLLLADSVANGLVSEMGASWAGFGVPLSASADIAVAGEATSLEEAHGNRSRGVDRQRIDDFLRGLSVSTGPSVNYLHVEKPHEPLFLLPDGRQYARCSCFSVDDHGAWPSSPMTTQRLQRYLLQAIYVDTLLGEVLDRMEANGLLDRAVFVVMSDHGVSLLPGTQNRILGDANINDLLPIPLFIKTPGQRSAVMDLRPVQLIDVLPTVLDVLGADYSNLRFDGHTLKDIQRDTDQLKIIDDQGTRVLDSVPSPSRSDLVEWLDLLFLVGDPFALGEFGHLVGLRIADLQIGESELRYRLETPTELRSLDDHVDAHVVGELIGAGESVDLALAVEGEIAGVGSTFFKDYWRISMIDPSSLFETPSDLEIYEIVDDGLRRVNSISAR